MNQPQRLSRRRFLRQAAGLTAVGGLGILATQVGYAAEPQPVDVNLNAVRARTQPPPLQANTSGQAAWPMYQRDPSHSGRSQVRGPRRPRLLRSFDVFTPDLLPARPGSSGQAIQSSPVIGADGEIYLSTFQSTILALRDPGAGSALQLDWKFQADGQTARHGTPALGADGVLYVVLGSGGTDAEGTLYALHAPATGTDAEVRWSAALGPLYQSSSPTIGPDGTIYVVGAESGVSPGLVRGRGTLRAFAPDGRLRWSTEVGPTLKTAPAVAPDGTVYIPAMDGFLYAVAPPPNGQGEASVRWRFEFGAHLGPTPLVTTETPLAGNDAVGSGASATLGPDGTIYVGANNSNFYAIRPDGELRWLFEATREIAGIWSTAALSADGSTLYFGTNAGTVDALNAADGTVRWEFDGYGSIFASPVLDAAGTLYVGGTVGHIFSLDAASGGLISDYDASGPVWSAPTVRPDGTLVVVARTGRVQLLGES